MHSLVQDEVDLKQESGLSYNSVLVTIILLLIITMSGLGGYFIGATLSLHHYQAQNQQSVKALYNRSPQPSPAEIIPSLPPVSQVGGWLTYADVKNGFSLKYPGTWSPVNLPILYGLGHFALTSVAPESLSIETVVKDLPGVEIVAGNASTQCKDSAMFAQQDINGLLTMKHEMVEKYPKSDWQYLSIRPLNNVKGYVANTGLPGQESMPAPGGWPEAIVYRCPLKLHISFNYPGTPENLKQFDIILSTLKVWTPKEYHPD
jgi:hypothetical protein